MFRRVLGGLLIVLIVVPFTAPFAVFDAATLFGRDEPASAQLPSPGSSVSDGTASGAICPFSASGRTRIIVRSESKSWSVRSILPLVISTLDKGRSLRVASLTPSSALRV